MKMQRGQEIVEFALLIPFFFIFFFGIMYCGFLFGDYITLSNMARSAAREAVIVGEKVPEGQENDPKAQASYKYLEKQYADMIHTSHMTTNLYTFDGITISETGNNPPNGVPADSVGVEIKATLNKDYAFPIVLENLGIGLPQNYNIVYYMYDENKNKT
ncbi:TadE/TadG family type IV pilus assembly protein [Dialister succinatiphilus]|uniref:TadE/TadG family type IV pilus assembly protein n=1 Tax=Dialister succinatiphilus TaxID=487173 RepID=UPI002354D68F|nr:TadE family protein [Dialister succinatiphilus]